MIVPRRFEPDPNRGCISLQGLDEAVVILACVEDHQAPPSAAAGLGDQHIVAMLGDIDGYKNGALRRRLSLGHGRSLLFGVVLQNHLRDPLAGRGRLPAS